MGVLRTEEQANRGQYKNKESEQKRLKQAKNTLVNYICTNYQDVRLTFFNVTVVEFGTCESHSYW